MEHEGNNQSSVPFTGDIKQFIDTVHWTFARTMPEWPHEYIVRDRVDERLFVKMVEHIRKYGYKGWFYRKPITYFDEDGLVYWTMGSPIPETTVINRTKKESSYEYRLKNGLVHRKSAKSPTTEMEKAPKPEPKKDPAKQGEFEELSFR